MGEMEYRIEALARQVNQMIRVGIVRNTHPRKGTVVVELADSDGVFTRPIPVLMPRTTRNASYDMPDIGEQVVCIFLTNSTVHGFVVGSPFSRVDRVPDGATQDMKIYQYKDGTRWSYDRKQPLLQV